MDFSALVWCPVGSKLLDTFGKQIDKHKHPMPTDKDDKINTEIRMWVYQNESFV